MRKLLLFLPVFCFTALFSAAQVNHVVISQVYGGGGNNGATYKNDFVELYNPTNAAVNLNGWSLQYANATGNFTNNNKVDLSGMIGAGKYFLIQLSDGNEGVSIPNPDATKNIGISSENGKIALVNNANLLNQCPNKNSYVDFVGYGNADCQEGAADDDAPSTNPTTAVIRDNNGCTDSDNNAADFEKQAPFPRNSASHGHTCGTALTVSSVSPRVLCITSTQGTTATITWTSPSSITGTVEAYIFTTNGAYSSYTLIGSATASGTTGTINANIPAGLPSENSYRIRVDIPTAYGERSASLEVLNEKANNASLIKAFPDVSEAKVTWANPGGCFDELMLVCRQGADVTGTPSGNGNAYTADANFKGNGTAFGGGKVVYKGNATSTLVTGLDLGVTYHFKLFTRRGIWWSDGISITTTTRTIAQAGSVLINAFSSRFAEAGDEYIELVNVTGSTINLADLAILYKTTSGGAGVVTQLSGSLPPHSFWLLADNPVTVGKTATLPQDGGSGGNKSDQGSVAIIRLKDEIVFDALGYGNAAAGTFEGSRAPAIPNTGGGLRRKQDGVDNNNNGTDFELINLTDIDLRNSASRLANTGASIAGGSFTRIYVTGNSALSGSTTISQKLVFAGGKLSLGNFNLQTAASEGSGTNSYVQTNGSGVFIQTNISTAGVLLPIGNSTYNPLTIAKGSGRSWQVRVEDAIAAENKEQAVQRTWHITPSQSITTGADITFSYNDGDAIQVGSNFDQNEDIQVWHQTSGSWEKAGDPETPTSSPKSTRTVTLNNWTQFSPFALANASVVLPLQFDAVRLQQAGKDLLIHFTVHSEQDIQHYEVETSVNGVTFTKKSVMLPRDNRGGTVHYTYTDGMPVGVDVYYRIRAVELNGKSRFSAVVKVAALPIATPFQIRPNPVVGNTIQYVVKHLAAGTYTVRIWDAAGRLVKTENLTHAGGAIWGGITIPALKKGWYLLDIHGGPTLRQTFVVW